MLANPVCPMSESMAAAGKSMAAASSRIPLTMLGLIQYLTPVLQFSFGVWLNHEAMPPSRWAGFGLWGLWSRGTLPNRCFTLDWPT